MLISTVFKQFLEERKAMRYSPHTIRDYQVTFKKFLALHGDVDIEIIHKQHIIQFLASQSNVSAKTLQNYLADLSALWQWAIQQGICEENPVRQVKAPIAEKKTIIPLSKVEVTALLESASQSPYHYRDRAIIFLLLDTGIRATELCNLQLKDLNRVTGYIRVIGKGKKERLLPVSEETIKAIDEYLTVRESVTPSSPLFALKCGKPLERCKLRKILSELGDKCGVSHVFPHRFRHTFAIQFLRNGGNIYSLQKILGHSTLDMVKRYLAISQYDLDHDHAVASPVRCWNLLN
jgi:site-specific recombinase XerD